MAAAVVLCCLALLGAARADITMSGRSTVQAMGMQGVGQETLWLKKTRIRRDMVDRGKAYSHLYDLNTREVTVINHSLRQAEVHTMATLSQAGDAQVASDETRFTLTSTGRKHLLRKWRCEEHELRLAMPVQIGGEGLSFELVGQIWLARKTREQRETAAFVKALQSEDFLMSLPAMNKISRTQARGIGEAIRRIAPKGMLCGVEVDLKYEGTGRVAELSRKMASHIGLSYDSYSSRPIADATFAIPAGYQVIRR